ncbi:hypothetical protein KJ641_02675 [Patescibacteria group bacterium]|nr:hypothetical protein [Patescibacteria group bacterium]
MKKKTLGILLLIGPFILLVVTLTLFAVSRFVLNGIEGSQTTPVSDISDSGIQELGLIEQSPINTAGSIIRLVLSLLGIIAVGGIFIGIPLGLYFLVKAENEKNYPKPPQPPFIQER